MLLMQGNYIFEERRTKSTMYLKLDQVLCLISTNDDERKEVELV
jgi:hypothetical protein